MSNGIHPAASGHRASDTIASVSAADCSTSILTTEPGRLWSPVTHPASSRPLPERSHRGGVDPLAFAGMFGAPWRIIGMCAGRRRGSVRFWRGAANFDRPIHLAARQLPTRDARAASPPATRALPASGRAAYSATGHFNRQVSTAIKALDGRFQFQPRQTAGHVWRDRPGSRAMRVRVQSASSSRERPSRLPMGEVFRCRFSQQPAQSVAFPPCGGAAMTAGDRRKSRQFAARRGAARRGGEYKLSGPRPDLHRLDDVVGPPANPARSRYHQRPSVADPGSVNGLDR